MNQEAHGGPIPEGSVLYDILPDFILQQMTIEGVTYQPTFLYESLWNILIFVLLIYMRRQWNPIRGEIFLTYAIMYSIGRFFIEGMRTDSLYVVGDLRTAQIVSILTIIIGLILIFYRRKTTTVRYKDVPKKKKKTKKRKK